MVNRQPARPISFLKPRTRRGFRCWVAIISLGDLLIGDGRLIQNVQNDSFRANWICRGALAAVRNPNCELPSTVLLLLS